MWETWRSTSASKGFLGPGLVLLVRRLEESGEEDGWEEGLLGSGELLEGVPANGGMSNLLVISYLPRAEMGAQLRPGGNLITFYFPIKWGPSRACVYSIHTSSMQRSWLAYLAGENDLKITHICTRVPGTTEVCLGDPQYNIFLQLKVNMLTQLN